MAKEYQASACLRTGLNLGANPIDTAGRIVFKAGFSSDVRQSLQGCHGAAVLVHQSKKSADANAVRAQETKPR